MSEIAKIINKLIKKHGGEDSDASEVLKLVHEAEDRRDNGTVLTAFERETEVTMQVQQIVDLIGSTTACKKAILAFIEEAEKPSRKAAYERQTYVTRSIHS